MDTVFEGFYITTEDCQGMEVAPETGFDGLIEAGTPIVCTYFDEHGMEFIDKEHGEFRLTKPCPVVPACSCNICGKIVATRDLECHKGTDDNCKNIRADKENMINDEWRGNLGYRNRHWIVSRQDDGVLRPMNGWYYICDSDGGIQLCYFKDKETAEDICEMLNDLNNK